jgi:serine/threonine protein kinase
LTPGKIILTVNESGSEQVKVTDFAVSDGRRSKQNLAYKSPEQLEGKLPNFASDIFSLAVVAYQILTNRLPFNASTAGELLNLQKKGVSVKASNLRLDLPPPVDEILDKALSFKASDRYPKARDFGDAFFNAMTSAAPWTKTEDDETKEEIKAGKTFETLSPAAVLSRSITDDSSYDDVEIELIDDDAPEPQQQFGKEISIKAAVPAVSESKTAQQQPTDLPWEKRSPEPIKVASKSWMLLSVLGLLALVAGLWLVWYYFLNRPSQTIFTPTEQQQQQQVAQEENSAAANDPNSASPVNNATPIPEEIESPPLERKILQPPNTEYFQNTRENLDLEMARFYRSFKFYYPKDWTKTPGAKNYVDVSRKNEAGIPLEQMLVTYYDSKGTFKDDSEKFPTLVRDSSKKLAELIPNYRLVSEGARQINGGWKIYEMKFEGTAEAKPGAAPLKVFGRRIFMPAMRKGVRGGFMITMLATSLSDVKSADEVGEKGELATVLKTFEPSPM